MAEEWEEPEIGVLGGEFVVLPDPKSVLKPGKIFIEACIKDNILNNPNVTPVENFQQKIQDDLTKQLSNPKQIIMFELLEDILASNTASKRLGPYYKNTIQVLQSLKVVEYVGAETESRQYYSSNVRIEVQAFDLYRTPRLLQESTDIPQGEITPMPHIRFESIWDELVFDHDIKGELIWMMTNICKFSQRQEHSTVSQSPEHATRDLNPLILLYGPPGTGKTTLCQGLAQKISIRLNHTYKQTKLIQIKTATLLSKYFSESAKQVDEIFTRLARMCEENKDEFFCVIIDEVESIAISREASAAGGESQDSLRATNALLTGLDRTKDYPNIMFLCTSNMLASLDSAFLDRCGLKQAVEPPSIRCQYEILRKRIQKQITRGIIQSEEVLPSYQDAELEAYLQADLPSNKLLHIVKSIRSGNAHAKSGKEISGRALTQLPDQAILTYLREDECDLNMAFSFISKFVRFEQSQGSEKKEWKDHGSSDGFNLRCPEVPEGIDLVEVRGKKRTLKVVIDEDCDLGLLEDMIATIRCRRQGSSTTNVKKEEGA